MKKSLGILLIAVLGGVVALGLNAMFNQKPPESVQELQQARFTNVQGLPADNRLDFVEVAAISTPTVVHIKNTMEQTTMNRGQDQLFDPFGMFDQRRFSPQPRQSSGSGVIISKEGHIVTNNHVIDNATKLEVTLNDKRTYIAELVGSDPETDLALLKIEEEGLPFLGFGNSDDVEVGQWVIAVGNPFNLTSTVTGGIISAKGRNINLLRQNSEYAIENFIQTDAAVNPGNSGGALVDMNGQLIGINTAIASQTGSYAGYAFAVPVNIARKVIDDLLKYGEVKRAILGVRIQDITSELAEEKGFDEIKGVYIPDVMQDGAADKAGIKAGDVILKIEGTEVNKSSDLQEQISKFHPGDEILLALKREGKEKEVRVTLRSKDGKAKIEETDKKEVKTVMGAVLENIGREERMKLKIKNGVKVVKLKGGLLEKEGVPLNFIITHIDKAPVYTTADVKKRLDNASGALLIEGVLSNGEKEAYAINVNK